MAVPAIDYTARDFDTIKEALKAHIQTKFPTTWRDMYESQMGIAWLELVAYSHDILSYLCDYIANEVFLPTARDRKNVLNICKLVGYRMRPPTSASVSVLASIAAPQLHDVIIQSGTEVSTERGVTFRVVEDQRIAQGDTEAEILFTQGQQQNDSFTSTGGAFQRFKLTTPGVVYGSVVVTVDGEEWSLEDSLVYGDGESKIYALDYDEDDYGYVQFGDGVSGQAPALNAVVEVAYRVGGGIQGNIAVGEISTTVQGVLDGVAPVTTVEVTLLNETRGSGGEDRETIQHAKLWAPKWVKTNGRAVTLEDFDVLANTFSDPVYGSPAFAKAKLHQDFPEMNQVDIYVWSRDYAGSIVASSTALKDAIEAYFNNNGAGAIRTICTDVVVLDGNNIYIDLAISVRVSSNYSEVEVTSAVNAAISALFSSAENIPGATFRISKVYQAVQAVLGVEYSLIDLITASTQDSEIIGVGDGVSQTFTDVLILDPGLSIVQQSVSIVYGDPVQETMTDDGEGNIINGVGTIVGSVDYNTGDVQVTFATAPGVDVQVVCSYREVIDYQRGELETTADGTTARFRGTVGYPPVVPLTSGMKGIAFSDGTQVVVDDGLGNMIGHVDPSGINRIDYQTGGYDFTFTQIPANGSQIRSTYRQALKTSSEDIPISEDQLAIKGLVRVSTL